MIVGLAREIKTQEYRVALTPQGVQQLHQDGHRVLVEQGAGLGSGFADDDYRKAWGELVDRIAVFASAEMIVKVKEPLPEEYDLLRPGQIIFTYLHLAPNPQLTNILLERRVTAFAYETLEQDGRKPLLAPMSKIAGRMAPLVGSYFLQRGQGGTGVLPCGIPGVAPARVVVIGAGTVGKEAARIAARIGMETVVLNRGSARLREIEQELDGAVRTAALDHDSLVREIESADMLVGALYATGGRTPVVITRAMLSGMRRGAVIVDVAIDQGGCVETSRPTTHDAPTYSIDGIMHYCVANMPGAYPNTATQALTGATLPFIRLLAKMGVDQGVRVSPELASALNLKDGVVLQQGLAAAMDTTLPRTTV